MRKHSKLESEYHGGMLSVSGVTESRPVYLRAIFVVRVTCFYAFNKSLEEILLRQMYHDCLWDPLIKVTITLRGTTNAGDGADVDNGEAEAALAPACRDTYHACVGSSIVCLSKGRNGRKNAHSSPQSFGSYQPLESPAEGRRTSPRSPLLYRRLRRFYWSWHQICRPRMQSLQCQKCSKRT